MHKILVVIGTHPEAIRAAPLIKRLRAVSSMRTVVCLAALDCEPLVLELTNFGIEAEEELGSAGQVGIEDLSKGVDRVITKHQPDCVLVYGDAGNSMASFRNHASFGNLGTGLRMYELHHHNPEGDGPHKIDLTATRYFVSSEKSRDSMLEEGVSTENLFVTDSTEVDAVLMVAERIRNDEKLKAKLAEDFSFLDPNKRLILVTGSRKNDSDGSLERLCRILTRLALRPDVQLAFLLHPDRQGDGGSGEIFAQLPNIALIQPQDYLHAVYLMQAAFLIISDPDDVPKGALSLKKPVLVMSNPSGDSETGESGTISHGGADAENILRECAMFLDDPSYYQFFSRHRNPYGDGHASQRIVETLLR